MLALQCGHPISSLPCSIKQRCGASVKLRRNVARPPKVAHNQIIVELPAIPTLAVQDRFQEISRPCLARVSEDLIRRVLFYDLSVIHKYNS